MSTIDLASVKERDKPTICIQQMQVTNLTNQQFWFSGSNTLCRSHLLNLNRLGLTCGNSEVLLERWKAHNKGYFLLLTWSSGWAELDTLDVNSLSCLKFLNIAIISSILKLIRVNSNSWTWSWACCFIRDSSLDGGIRMGTSWTIQSMFVPVWVPVTDSAEETWLDLTQLLPSRGRVQFFKQQLYVPRKHRIP